MYTKLNQDYKEQKAQYSLLVDENGEIAKQNSDYRGLILQNEEKLQQIAKEIAEFHENIRLKNRAIKKAQEETKVY